MSTLTRKGYARIYVEKPEDVEKVKAIIKELDEFEHEYLPEKLVAPFAEYPALEYTHKFDALDMNALTALCRVLRPTAQVAPQTSHADSEEAERPKLGD